MQHRSTLRSSPARPPLRGRVLTMARRDWVRLGIRSQQDDRYAPGCLFLILRESGGLCNPVCEEPVTLIPDRLRCDRLEDPVAHLNRDDGIGKNIVIPPRVM